jgi:glycosyl transferase family 25
MQNFKIIVISLQRSLLRRQKVHDEFLNTGLEWSFVDAVDGTQFKNLPSIYKRKKVERLLGYGLTKNEIACYLSHKLAWNFCVTNNKTTVIFEDDFRLTPNFKNTIELLLTEPINWDLIRLQALYDVDFELVNNFGDFNVVKNTGDAVGATAYMLKPSTALELIKFSHEIYEPVDHFLEHTSKHGLSIMALRPYPVLSSGIISTIDDRSIRKPIRGFRKLKRSFYRSIDRLISSNPWFPK